MFFFEFFEIFKNNIFIEQMVLHRAQLHQSTISIKKA